VLKSILQLLLSITIGLLLFVIFHLLGQWTAPFDSLSALVITILLQPVSGRMGAFFAQKISPGKYTLIEKELDRFEEATRLISHYHELFPQYYQLFNTVFPAKSWLFYVFDQEGFRHVEFDTSLTEESVPEGLNIHPISSGELVLEVIPLTKMTSTDVGFSVEEFLNIQMDTLITVRGKTQVVALIFVRQKNLEFLRNREIRFKTERVLVKSAQILESTALYLDVVQRNLEIKKLFEVSKKLMTSLNTDEILNFLLDALNEVVQFDAGVIFLINRESRKLVRKASKGYDKDLDLTLKLGQGACGWVAETKQISLIPDVEQAEHYYPIRPQTRSQVSLPLMWQEDLVGVLSLESDEKSHFTPHALELLRLFANQAAIALHNAHQYEISLTKNILEHELLNAGKVQKVLLPQAPPNMPGLNVSFAHIPSKIVSGDLFDLVAIDDQLLGLVIGDVSGKGAAAAIMMSLVLAGFRAFKKSHLAVCEIVARLNNLLEESISEGKFATLFYSLISTKDDIITYTNAGHNPPIIFRTDGTVDKLSIGGLVLGYLQNEVYKQTTLPFKKGDLLLCYTDGITEALNQNDEEFGEQRLQQVVRKNIHLSSYDLRNAILQEVNQFTELDDELSDDRTLLIVKYS
jgi:serine phosphatase RsbU (regulator of sigma subunit)